MRFRIKMFMSNCYPLALPAIIEITNRDQSLTNFNLERFINSLQFNEWSSIAENLISPEWLQVQVEQMLDTFFAVMEGDFSGLGTEFDTEQLQRNLIGDNAPQIAEGILNSFPGCTDEQLQAYENFTDDSDLANFTCL